MPSERRGCELVVARVRRSGACDLMAVDVLLGAVGPELFKRFNPLQRRGPDGKWSGGRSRSKKKPNHHAMVRRIRRVAAATPVLAAASVALLAAAAHAENVGKAQDARFGAERRWNVAKLQWMTENLRTYGNAGPPPPHPWEGRRSGKARVNGRRTNMEYAPHGTYNYGYAERPGQQDYRRPAITAG